MNSLQIIYHFLDSLLEMDSDLKGPRESSSVILPGETRRVDLNPIEPMAHSLRINNPHVWAQWLGRPTYRQFVEFFIAGDVLARIELRFHGRHRVSKKVYDLFEGLHKNWYGDHWEGEFEDFLFDLEVDYRDIDNPFKRLKVILLKEIDFEIKQKQSHESAEYSRECTN